MTPTILHIAVPTPLAGHFDYLPPADCDVARLQPGVRVSVPFGWQTLTGILVGLSTTTEVPLAKLKAALVILDEAPLIPASLIALARWTSEYYHYPLGEVLTSLFPARLRQGKTVHSQRKSPLKKRRTVPAEATTAPLCLNAEQQLAVTAMVEAFGRFQAFLLEGVTGSGKTEVYLQGIAAVLARQQQALVLVPEISLTPQTVARFQQRFAVPIAVLHSGLTEAQRLQAWLAASTGSAPIVIGTRSAIFTPLLNVGVIIIDEAHDSSFKQQEGLRYSARDLALVRGRLENVPVMLGTATPSLESLYHARAGRYQHLILSQRAGSAQPPRFQIVDIRNQPLQEGLSAALIEQIAVRLKNQEQVLLFLNRRGYAPTLICHRCGWIAQCRRCDARMTVHLEQRQLHCHHCDTHASWIKTCPQCHGQQLVPLGLGTQRLEQLLQQHFPTASIARMDRDSLRKKDSLAELLTAIAEGQHHILIGTQMLAKGHHFPNVTLVAIIDADGGLFSSDFRALEHMAQLLMQVAGRAGRAEKNGVVMIQSRHPEHPLLLQLVQQGYSPFAESLLLERQTAQLPPFSYLALFRAESAHKERPAAFLQEVKTAAMQCNNTVKLLGPIPALMERRCGRYRALLLLQTPQRAPLHALLKTLLSEIPKMQWTNKVRWSLDVDPLDV